MIPLGRRLRSNRRWVNRVIFAVTVLLTLLAFLIPFLTSQQTGSLTVGAVAPQDFQAPYSDTFESQTLTQQARQRAAQSVLPIYLPPDPSITRNQVELQQSVLHYIDLVRSDAYADTGQKISDLGAVQGVDLNQQMASGILGLSDARWQRVQQEAVNLLQGAMRNPIRESDLNSVLASLPSMVSLDLSDQETAIALTLTRPFVAPNSLYSPDQTQAAREKASAAITAVTQSYAQGESIVRSGEIITPQAMEALNHYNLIQNAPTWGYWASVLGLVALLVAAFAAYAAHRDLPFATSTPRALVSALMFLVFLYAGRALAAWQPGIAHLLPLQALAISLVPLFGLEPALVLGIPLSLLVPFALPDTSSLILFYLVVTFFGTLVLGRGRRIGNFFSAGIASGAAGSLLLAIIPLAQPAANLTPELPSILSALVGGLLAGPIALLIQNALAQPLGLTPPLQLMELLRPDHPLLRLLIQNAPGTYQHSLQVSNLAEQAAEAIGADGLLTRVGAFYHDVGKSTNPQYFIENQIPGQINPHDQDDPEASAHVIIQHVLDGLQLADRYHLPERVKDFIREHHGTRVVRYYYALALEAAGSDPSKVDAAAFRYPGPSPQSRETALLMLADSCEARSRAELPQTPEKLHELISSVFDTILQEGQLDETDITFKELSIAEETIYETLRNTYHPRIRYPEIPPSQMPAPPALGDSEARSSPSGDRQP